MPNSNEQNERRQTLLIGAVMLAAILLGGVAVIFFSLRFQVEPPPPFEPVKTMLVRAEPPANDFVGSAKCSRCHEKIAAKYASSAKAHSLRPIHSARQIEDYESPLPETQPASYRVAKGEDGEVTHHEFADGIYDQAESIQYVLGSGRRERAYLLERSGVLFQSPIKWNVETSKWSLMQDSGTSNGPRFLTRINDDCLRCHSGAALPQARNAGRYKPPIFVESAIGCEQCHGPGGRHVAKQSKRRTPGEPDDTIVNPAKIGTRRQEHLCAHCHLRPVTTIPRFGASLLDFRAGDLVDESIGAMLAKPENDLEYRMADQVQQLRGSACYINSNSRLTCLSCHDAHAEPAEEEKHQFFSSKCLQCHADKGCSVPQEKRKEKVANDSCIACHMPRIPTNDRIHMTLTDHRIRPRPQAIPSGSVQTDWGSLRPFDSGDERLPAGENQRMRALALVRDAVMRNDMKAAEKVGKNILPKQGEMEATFKAINGDIPTLSELSRLAVMFEQGALAMRLWDEILKHDPNHESALNWMAATNYDGREHEVALELIDRLIKINPSVSATHTRRAMVLLELDRRDEAIESAITSLRLNPTLIRLRLWLSDRYKETGAAEAAAKQAELAEKLRAAGFLDIQQ